jgi:outer membrane protein
MKLFSKALLVLLFALPIGAFAQTKVGHVNTSKIMEVMPEVKVASAKLDSLNKSYQARMKELLDDYQTQLQALQSPEANQWTETIKSDKEKALQQLGERIQTFKETANNDLQKKQEEMMTPIRKKLNDAIQDVATAGKYTLVLDSGAQGIVLFSTDTDDLTVAVKKKLGL